MCSACDLAMDCDSHLLPRLARYERSLVLRALRGSRGSVRAAAVALGLPESSLRHRISRLGIDAETRAVREELRKNCGPTSQQIAQ